MIGEELVLELAGTPEEILAAIGREAEACGGEWSRRGAGGELALPVVFGLKRGVERGRVDVAASAGGSRLHWRCEQSELAAHRPAVAILALAAGTLLPGLAWPFHPPLLAILPFGAVCGLLAWWVVISRLRTSGPREFFEELPPHPAEPA